MALEAAVKVFGADRNSKGFLVPRGCGVIQGDGIGLKIIAEILDAVVTKGYSAQVRTSCGTLAVDDFQRQGVLHAIGLRLPALVPDPPGNA